MPPQRVTPEWVAAQTTTAHGGQVGGHPGSLQHLVGPNGENLVIKESLASEPAFYEDLYEPGLLPGESEAAAERRKELRERWTPTFYGSLPLSSAPADPASQGAGPTDAQKASANSKGRIIISDLLANFKRPCVMDVKLGTQLWDEDASEEKRIRMDKASKETTSWETGLRVTGWRVWDPEKEEFLTFSKAFGRKACVSALRAAMDSFFGSFQGPSDMAAFDELLESFGEEEAIREQHQDMSWRSLDFQDVLVSLIETYILPRVEQIRALVASLEMRMRGGSILLIYEGDEEELPKRYAALSADAETKERTPPPAAVYLIDFAHAKFRHADHAGRDDGVIMGIDKLISLLHGRMDLEWRDKHYDWLPTRGAEAPPPGPKAKPRP